LCHHIQEQMRDFRHTLSSLIHRGTLHPVNSSLVCHSLTQNRRMVQHPHQLSPSNEDSFKMHSLFCCLKFTRGVNMDSCAN
jgi:hypothetical protein